MSEEEPIEGARRRRVLSNGQVLAFVWRRWMRRPGRLALILSFMLGSTLCDLSIPWAAGALVNAVADPARHVAIAWKAWAMLAGLYVFFYGLRQVSFRAMNSFAARNMEELTNEAFTKVQAFSSDWHGDTFAGSTVRKISRGMWGYDSISDVLILMLGPALVVLIGLSFSLMARQPVAGVVSLAVVLVYMAANVLLTTRWVRPRNLKSRQGHAGRCRLRADRLFMSCMAICAMSASMCTTCSVGERHGGARRHARTQPHGVPTARARRPLRRCRPARSPSRT
jgi:ATP-binding cassette subfamily B protein